MADETVDLLSNLVWPEGKYARSTNIILDGRIVDGIPDFKFTSKSLRFLDDLLDSIQGIRRDRAWSIVGPYGSGKSTFMLFLLQLLGGKTSSWLDRCMVQLRLASPEIENRVNNEIIQQKAKYIPVVIQGSRIPLDLALCKSLQKAASDANRDTQWVSQSFLSSLNIAIETIETGINDSLTTIGLYEQAANLAEIAGYKGILVTVDEFGKFLERARWQGDLPDLITAQYLAELTSSLNKPQIMFTVALHQGFQHYASTLSKQQWLEWVKIQGRFRQVDFNEEPENLYGLVAASLNFKGDTDRAKVAINDWVSRVWDQVKTLPAFETESSSDYWTNLLSQVYPLHPITLYSLPRLSTHLGQNERTLFTFLASDDPLGFKSFLRKTKGDVERLPSLTVDYLYDYFIAGSRFSWLPVDIQRKVTEIEAALERLGDRPSIEMRLLKIIGVLSLLKTGSMLPASKEVLHAALDIDCCVHDNNLEDAIKRLESRKIIVYKRFAGEYRIWRGTDFDFDLAQTRAKDEIQMSFDLTDVVNGMLECRPLLARRHSFESGTTRLFQVKLITANDLLCMTDLDLSNMIDNAESDGILLYVIPDTLDELAKLREFVCNISEPRILLTIPKEPIVISSLVLGLAALRRIPDNLPEIRDDDVAVKELASRIESTEDFLNESLNIIMEPAHGRTDFYWRGQKKNIPDRRSLNVLLSEVCDSVYPNAPVVRNELINRQILSSSVVVAVKKILSCLLASVDDEKLGFKGNGPEVSIFTAIFEELNLYGQNEDGKWKLKRPEEDTLGGIKDVWMEIESFLRSSNSSLEKLYIILSAPPYGLRKGLISLLIWIVLIYYRRVISLYENNTYIKDWSTEVFDLFLKMPSLFTARWLLLSDTEGQLLQRLNDVIPGAVGLIVEDGNVPLNGFLTNLYGWYGSLTDYSKNTESLSAKTRKLRSVLLTVADPVELIFNAIPNALGLENISSITSENENIRSKYFRSYVSRFRRAVKDIDSSYSSLINQITEYMSQIIGCSPDISDIRLTLSGIEPELLEYVIDSDTKAVLLRSRQIHNDDLSWIESVVSILSGQPPKFWLDFHLNNFKGKFTSVILSIEDARRRYYARSILENVGRPLKRITFEDQGQLIIDDCYSQEDIDGLITETSHTLVEQINGRPGLTHRTKQLIVAKMLELLVDRNA